MKFIIKFKIQVIAELRKSPKSHQKRTIEKGIIRSVVMIEELYHNSLLSVVFSA